MITAFFQLLIAGIVGALVTIKFWCFLKNFLSKIFKKNNQNNQNDGTNNPINKS